MSDEDEFYVEFSTKASSDDLGCLFLSQVARGGAPLGTASARGDVDFALSGAKVSTPRFVTTKGEKVKLQVPRELIRKDAKKDYEEDIGERMARLKSDTKVVRAADPVLFLSARARLNITATRLGVGIDGTVCDTLSGQSSVLVKDLVLDKNLIFPPTGVCQDEPVEFSLVPLHYGALRAQVDVLGIHDLRFWQERGGKPVECCLALVGEKTDAEQTKKDNELKCELIEQLYTSAWANCERFKFALSENLTKAVMSVPCGFGGCGYSPAAAVNDTPASFSDELTERILRRCIGLQQKGEDTDAMCKALRTPDPSAALKYAEVFGDALSCFAAFAVPYRVDGLVHAVPNGLAMCQSESWRAEALRSMRQGDDCDGTACLATSVIAQAEAVAKAGATDFPVLRALGNVAAFYVYGTAVLAANAGNADAANGSDKHVAGHAICLMVPKPVLFGALQRGARIADAAGKPTLAESKWDAASGAWFDALFPEELREKIANDDFESQEALTESVFNDPVNGFKVIAVEGTTLASSRLYTHDAADRAKRAQYYANEKKLGEIMCPNIFRTKKCLDSGGRGEEHAFYGSFVEFSMSLKHPLLTSRVLRELGAATCHVRFTAPDGPAAGATPRALAEHRFAVVGLWYIDGPTGKRMDEANAEAAVNVMPRRDGPLSLSALQLANLDANIATLRDIDKTLQPVSLDENGGAHTSTSILSFASLVGNKAAIVALKETIEETDALSGSVSGLEKVVEGLAVDGDEQDRGLFVSLKLLSKNF